MEPSSVKMVCNLLAPDSRVLEWGAGGSTLFSAEFVHCRNTMIEHDETWIPVMAIHIEM